MNKRKKEESVKKNARPKNDLSANVPLPNDVPVKRLAPNYKVRCRDQCNSLEIEIVLLSNFFGNLA